MSLMVKICGLRTPEAVDVAVESGADLVGFVFFPPSPRHLGLDTARALGGRVKDRAGKVALTVDADDETLAAIVAALQPDILQLHGKETPERVAGVRQRFGLPVMKALPIETKGDFEQVRDYAAVADWILLDAKAPADATRPGGLGKPFDWALLSGAIPSKPVMLSGGLNADNVAEALRITRVPAVDVSSGVESEPGIKDPKKIREFIRIAREAFVRLPSYEALSNP